MSSMESRIRSKSCFSATFFGWQDKNPESISLTNIFSISKQVAGHKYSILAIRVQGPSAASTNSASDTPPMSVVIMMTLSCWLSGSQYKDT